MIQTDFAQLSMECNSWRHSLRSHRDGINSFKQQLQLVAGKNLSRNQLQEVEHYQNQFLIQLINVHDLKQAVKAHERRVSFELSANSGDLQDETLVVHEQLLGQFQLLDETLLKLKDAFSIFLSGIS